MGQRTATAVGEEVEREEEDVACGEVWVEGLPVVLELPDGIDESEAEMERDRAMAELMLDCIAEEVGFGVTAGEDAVPIDTAAETEAADEQFP